MGGALAGYLPKEWNGKRVAVRFTRGRGFDARLVGDNAGGITVEPIKEDAEEEHARSAFVPWAAVRYIQLLEEPSEPQRARPKSRRTPRLSLVAEAVQGLSAPALVGARGRAGERRTVLNSHNSGATFPSK